MKEVNIIIPEDLVTINRIEYDFLLNERQRNKELKQKINKAINYIEKINPQEMYPDHYMMIKYISDILKGE